VLEPPELVERVREELKGALAGYEKRPKTSRAR
jgi:hypothetical protein